MTRPDSPRPFRFVVAALCPSPPAHLTSNLPAQAIPLSLQDGEKEETYIAHWVLVATATDILSQFEVATSTRSLKQFIQGAKQLDFKADHLLLEGIEAMQESTQSLESLQAQPGRQ